MNENQVNYGYPPGYEPVVPFGEWLKLLCINFVFLIPIIGWIIGIVIYVVKMSDKSLSISMRNMIKAGFIYFGITVGISIAFGVFVSIIAFAAQ